MLWVAPLSIWTGLPVKLGPRLASKPSRRHLAAPAMPAVPTPPAICASAALFLLHQKQQVHPVVAAGGILREGHLALTLTFIDKILGVLLIITAQGARERINKHLSFSSSRILTMPFDH